MPGRWYDPRPFFDNRTLTLCPPRRPAGRRGGSAVLARDDTVIPSQSEAYQYDTVNRLTQFTRGTPGGTGATPTATWTLDALGNWRSSTANGVETDRTHNAQNQVATVRAAGSPTPTPLGYDADGNTLADNTGQQYAYDAWNRLVTVKNGSGTTLAAFTYDAQGRRVTEAESGTTTALYYSKNWQVLETRQAGTATQQYVWSPFYVDGLVERDDHTPAEAGTALDRRLYAEQDADYNVTSLTNSSGSVVERYAYDPYGAVTVEDAGGGVRGSGLATASSYDWTVLHQGLRLDVTTGTYDDRNRVYMVGLGRFGQEDPSGYVDGQNTYQLELSNPGSGCDPLGLADRTTSTPSTGPTSKPTGPLTPTEIARLRQLEKDITTDKQTYAIQQALEQIAFQRFLDLPANASAACKETITFEFKDAVKQLQDAENKLNQDEHEALPLQIRERQEFIDLLLKLRKRRNRPSDSV